jgi:multiple sugar transport system permease protein
MIWGVAFSGDSYGYVNSILMRLGLIQAPIQFFQNAEYVMPLCIVVALWSSLGTSFLSFIGGLQTIDKAQFEAAAVDGIKNRWQELWYVTLPNMKSQLLFGAILAITSAFGFGAVVDGLAGNPSVDYCAWTIVHHLGDYGGARFEVGYASAIATILFAMMVGSNMLVKKILAKVGQ